MLSLSTDRGFRPKGRSGMGKVQLILAVFSLSIALSVPAAHGVQMTIPGTANLWGAGLSVMPSGGARGTLPPVFTLASGGGTLVFSQVTGQIKYGTNQPFHGPDGSLTGPSDINPSPHNDISGYKGSTRAPLVGVFRDGAAPVPGATPPATLDFSGTGLGMGFDQLFPGLNQVFFIGDGLSGTGSGTQQQFHIPTGATRLFLGTVDGPNFFGNPKYFSDNGGEFYAEFDYVGETPPTSAVPEPTTALLLASGLLGLIGYRRWRR